MVLRKTILIMISEFKYLAPFCIHETFPHKKLIEIFKPYLRLYLIHKYSISQTDEQFQSHLILRSKLKKLYDYNPKLGKIFFVQKIPKALRTDGENVKMIRTFNYKYLPFHKIPTGSNIYFNAVVDDDDSDSSSSEIEDSEELRRLDTLLESFQNSFEDEDEDEEAIFENNVNIDIESDDGTNLSDDLNSVFSNDLSEQL